MQDPSRKPLKKRAALAIGAALFGGLTLGAALPAAAQDTSKPNILFIMGDDIGWMQTAYYHRGLMVGETPNIDRIGQEGTAFTDYYAEASCTSGRNAFFTGMTPLRTGMTVPQLPGSPAYLRAGTPTLAKILLDLGYNTGEFGKNHLGDHAEALPTAHGFQEFWGYLYHLDAMQQVSFPDINASETEQTVAPPCKVDSIPGVPDLPNAVDPATTTCLTPPRPMLSCTSSDGSQANMTCSDAGLLTLKRTETIDEEISSHVVDYLDRNDPKKTGKPFFVWYNPARMHVTTVLPPKYMDMLGEKGGKDWGVNEAGMKQMDDNIGVVLQKLEEMGQLDNTIIVFTTDNGAEKISFPDGGVSPFKGQKGEAWEGGFRSPMMIRWPGHVPAGKWTSEIFSSLDWLPTLTDLAGGPKGNDLRDQIEKGAYPGFVKTHLDGYDQADFLTAKTEKSAREVFFYYSGTVPSAVRYKNWKMYYNMSAEGADGWLLPLVSYHFTLMDNIKRDPFEAAIGSQVDTAAWAQGALAAPMTAYIYDWNLLPIGQQLWYKELMSYKEFPPLQLAASYNLESILDMVKKSESRGD